MGGEFPRGESSSQYKSYIITLAFGVWEKIPAPRAKSLALDFPEKAPIRQPPLSKEESPKHFSFGKKPSHQPARGRSTKIMGKVCAFVMRKFLCSLCFKSLYRADRISKLLPCGLWTPNQFSEFKVSFAFCARSYRGLLSGRNTWNVF